MATGTGYDDTAGNITQVMVIQQATKKLVNCAHNDKGFAHRSRGLDGNLLEHLQGAHNRRGLARVVHGGEEQGHHHLDGETGHVGHNLGASQLCRFLHALLLVTVQLQHGGDKLRGEGLARLRTHPARRIPQSGGKW